MQASVADNWHGLAGEESNAGLRAKERVGVGVAETQKAQARRQTEKAMIPTILIIPIIGATSRTKRLNGG
jgi:hypothetical protein